MAWLLSSFVSFLPRKANNDSSNIPTFEFIVGVGNILKTNSLRNVRLDLVPFQKLAKGLEILL